MFRRIEDFIEAWNQESEATLKILGACTDGSLAQVIAPGRRTLGRLAWHLVLTMREMPEVAGLPVGGPAATTTVPPLSEIVHAYETAAHAVSEAVSTHWTDAMLGEHIPMYGEQWRRGEMLLALIVHQAHHRGQMTVLMRQAGLKVPGIYGPAAEEWAAMGMAAQA